MHTYSLNTPELLVELNGKVHGGDINYTRIANTGCISIGEVENLIAHSYENTSILSRVFES